MFKKRSKLLFDNFYKPSHPPLIRLCRRWWRTEQKTSSSPQAIGGVPSVTTLIGERILLVLKEKIWNKFKPPPIGDRWYWGLRVVFRPAEIQFNRQDIRIRQKVDGLANINCLQIYILINIIHEFHSTLLNFLTNSTHPALSLCPCSP